MGFIDIQKNTGFGNGVLSYHLKVLEKQGAIRIKRGKRKIWIFGYDLDPTEDVLRIFLRKETCKNILVFLLEKETANFSQIKDVIRKSPSTTSLTLRMLTEKNLVRIIPGFPKQYSIEDREKTLQVLNTIKISHMDEFKDRFADTFSYF